MIKFGLRAEAPLKNITRIVTETEESVNVNDSLKGRPVFSEVFQIERHEFLPFPFVISGFST